MSHVLIPSDVEICFVSDFFVEDVAGGAEMTSQALLDSCPFNDFNVYKIKSRDVTIETLASGHGKFWIFGNFAHLDQQLIPSIIANLKYAVIEYDYKACHYRSPEKHREVECTECNCHESNHGKLISAFYMGAKSLWWMSEGQKAWYEKIYPFLAEKESTVLSSVFDENFFSLIETLHNRIDPSLRTKWIVLGSNSWIKGTDAAIDYCQKSGLDYEVVLNLNYVDLLRKLSQSKGLVFLPRGKDTCPRLVIEAKLLGCQLVLNDNVQHKDEEWFATDDRDLTLSYLYAARERFWQAIKSTIGFQPTISGYTTTLNCVSQDYPFIESIKSMLGFCDEVVVVDGGSDDGTLEKLNELSALNPQPKVFVHRIDKTHPRFALDDGRQKARARAHCTKDFCWQQDSDEVVHENSYASIKGIVRDMPNSLMLLSLPVIDYWGTSDRARIDVMPWKWRLSRNLPFITHGVPGHMRVADDSGDYHARPGTDGCDYVHTETLQLIPHGSFYTQDVDNLRKVAVFDHDARNEYQKWYNAVTTSLPSVHHYSWWDIGRKIRTYRDYWSKHWQSLYNIVQEDLPENNMFFDKAWSDVTEDEIDQLAKLLDDKMCGWVFHTKVDFSRETLGVYPVEQHPEIIKQWAEVHTW